MSTYADKTQEGKSRSVASIVTQKKNSSDSTFQFVDNRPDAVVQQNLHKMANNCPRETQLSAFQNKLQKSDITQRQVKSEDEVAENRTGMPDQLKSGLEQLSGLNLSAVRVHRNSARPAQVNAHAYAQGQDIHLGPGQDQHLPHEGWHVVQQMQGRVNPTMQVGNVAINDNRALEQEADRMGAKAAGR
ncbi:DUF4157 domain-containing protein [cf. Phormidesmis sp. LEGE 11477]|uniref:eCIS core domain-containing protein n=1 Tax=cf. Phormidesmis sp. LEGE 11477 TaxID=1828680 RepID=UPI00187F0EDA|nr:DUF4157 domain-containing protein [cf. Phormidesmis sp. LEGE 11477]MBE9062407.1 DUF4157 domain-containing protein [cf. Phormidesmis sp. LEGE 11477]